MTPRAERRAEAPIQDWPKLWSRLRVSTHSNSLPRCILHDPRFGKSYSRPDESDRARFVTGCSPSNCTSALPPLLPAYLTPGVPQASYPVDLCIPDLLDSRPQPNPALLHRATRAPKSLASRPHQPWTWSTRLSLPSICPPKMPTFILPSADAPEEKLILENSLGGRLLFAVPKSEPPTPEYPWLYALRLP